MSLSNTNVRDLTPAELELVAGGEITITGERWDPYEDRWWYEQMFEDNFYGEYDGQGGPEESPPPPPNDSAVHEVVRTFTRPLTAAETAAVNKLNTEIAKITTVINSIPDTHRITLFDGSTVTGAELKTIWAATDFRINEVGTAYANGTTLGEANWNNGDPIISYNINTMVSYNQHTGGMDFLILHEIGHMTANSRAHLAVIDSDNVITTSEMDTHQKMANDIARAIATYGSSSGLQVMANPGSGYSTTVPTFQSSGSTGGSGTAYYTYDLPFAYTDYYWTRYNLA